MIKYAPLPHEWMLVSIIGFIISLLEVWPNWSQSWGFAFMVFFGIMFIGSVVSLSATGLSREELIELAVHEQPVRAGKHRKKKK
jgi:hypothetical protein